MNVHEDKRPFKCDFCEKAFHRKSGKMIHQNNVHKREIQANKYLEGVKPEDDDGLLAVKTAAKKTRKPKQQLAPQPLPPQQQPHQLHPPPQIMSPLEDHPGSPDRVHHAAALARQRTHQLPTAVIPHGPQQRQAIPGLPFNANINIPYNQQRPYNAAAAAAVAAVAGHPYYVVQEQDD